jgi:hypothetical protein
MTPTLPLGHEPFGPELEAEGVEAEWRIRVIHERNYRVSMGMSFFVSCPIRNAPAGPDLWGTLRPCGKGHAAKKTPPCSFPHVVFRRHF